MRFHHHSAHSGVVGQRYGQRRWRSSLMTPSVENLTNSGQVRRIEAQWMMLQRQIQNLIDSEQKPTVVKVVNSKRFSIILGATGLMFFIFFYVLIYCYPQAVFLWGDAVAVYRRTIAKRKFLYGTVLVGFLVNIAAGIVLFATTG